MPIQVPRAGALCLMKYAFYSDPSHGWMKVSTEEINLLAIAQDITPFSYITNDRKYIYLEEDQDLNTFINAVLAADWFENIAAIRNCTKKFDSNSPSFIRNLDSYSPEFILKPNQPVYFEM